MDVQFDDVVDDVESNFVVKDTIASSMLEIIDTPPYVDLPTSGSLNLNIVEREGRIKQVGIFPPVFSKMSVCNMMKLSKYVPNLDDSTYVKIKDLDPVFHIEFQDRKQTLGSINSNVIPDFIKLLCEDNEEPNNYDELAPRFLDRFNDISLAAYEEFNSNFTSLKDSRMFSSAKCSLRLSEAILSRANSIPRGHYYVTHAGSCDVFLIKRGRMRVSESGCIISRLSVVPSQHLNVLKKLYHIKILHSESNLTLVYYLPQTYSLTEIKLLNTLEWKLLSSCSYMPNFDRSDLSLIYMVSLNRGHEAFTVLSLLRYLIPSLNSPYSCIDKLWEEKLGNIIPCHLAHFLIRKVEEYSRKRQRIIVKTKESLVTLSDVTSANVVAKLPFSNKKGNIRELLFWTYLVSFTEGKTSSKRHVYLRLCNTLLEYKDDTYNRENLSVVKNQAELLKYYIIDRPITDMSIFKLLRTKSVFPKFSGKKLFDEVINVSENFSVEKINQLLFRSPVKINLSDRDDRSGEREIFVTDVQTICKLTVLERLAHDICEQLDSEMISKPGERKFQIFQGAVQSAYIRSKSDSKYVAFTLDASKWSTGDSLSIYEVMAETFWPDHTWIKDFLKDLANREVYLPKKFEDYLSKRGISNPIRGGAGWPQGFLNKFSTLKHYLMMTRFCSYVYSKLDKKLIISFFVHSDDSYILIESDELDSITIGWVWSCLVKACEEFCIRVNLKKSCIGSPISEFLSYFTVGGGTYVPQIKYLVSACSDLPGKGYPYDMLAGAERIRSFMRYAGQIVPATIMLTYMSHFIRRLYSMLPGMIMQSTNMLVPIECGGIWNASPLFTMFFGSRAHNAIVFKKDPNSIQACTKLWELIQYETTSGDWEAVDAALPIPILDYKFKNFAPYKGYIKCPDWHYLYISDLNYKEGLRAAKNMLSFKSIKLGYRNSSILATYQAILNHKKSEYYLGEKMIKLNEYIDHAYKMEGKPLSKEETLNLICRKSPVLLSLMDCIDASVEILSIQKVDVIGSTISILDSRTPGAFKITYPKYALAKILNLDINYPSYIMPGRFDLDIKLASQIINSMDDPITAFKKLNLSMPHPTYIHTQEPVRLDETFSINKVLDMVCQNFTLGKRIIVDLVNKEKSVPYRINYITLKPGSVDCIYASARLIQLGCDLNLNDEVCGVLLSSILYNKPQARQDMQYYIDFYFLLVHFNVTYDDIELKYKEDSNGVLLNYYGSKIYMDFSFQISLNKNDLGKRKLKKAIAFCTVLMMAKQLKVKVGRAALVNPELVLNYEEGEFSFEGGAIIKKWGKKSLRDVRIVDIGPDLKSDYKTCMLSELDEPFSKILFPTSPIDLREMKTEKWQPYHYGKKGFIPGLKPPETFKIKRDMMCKGVAVSDPLFQSIIIPSLTVKLSNGIVLEIPKMKDYKKRNIRKMDYESVVVFLVYLESVRYEKVDDPTKKPRDYKDRISQGSFFPSCFLLTPLAQREIFSRYVSTGYEFSDYTYFKRTRRKCFDLIQSFEGKPTPTSYNKAVDLAACTVAIMTMTMEESKDPIKFSETRKVLARGAYFCNMSVNFWLRIDNWDIFDKTEYGYEDEGDEELI